MLKSVKKNTILRGVSFISFLIMTFKEKSKLMMFFMIPYLGVTIPLASMAIHTKFYSATPVKNVLYISMTLMVIPILLFVGMTFKFLYRKNSADFYFSIPISKPSLFFGNYIAGMIVSIVPSVLYSYMFYALSYAPSGNLTIHGVSVIIGKLVLILLCFYSFFALIAVNTGNYSGQIMMSVGAVLTLPTMILGIFLFAQNVLVGFNMKSLISVPVMGKLLSILAVVYSDRPFDGVSLIILMMVSLLLVTAACISFCRIKPENVSLWMSTSILYPPLKGIITIAGGSCIILFLLNSRPFNLLTLVYATFISMLFYIIIDIILERDLYSFIKLRSINTFCVSWGLFCLLAIFINNGFFGYIDRIPQRSEIEYVSYSTYDGVNEIISDSLYGFREPANIDKIIELHSKTLQLGKEIYEAGGNDVKYDEKRPYSIFMYKLKDGGVIERYYEACDDSTRQLNGEIKDTDECKLVEEPLMRITEDNLSYIYIQNAGLLKIDDVKLMNKILSALKEDKRLLLSSWLPSEKASGRKNNSGGKSVKKIQYNISFITEWDERLIWSGNSMNYIYTLSVDENTPRTLQVLKDLDIQNKMISGVKDCSVETMVMDITDIRDDVTGKPLLVKDLSGFHYSEYSEVFGDPDFNGTEFILTDRNFIDPIMEYCEKNPETSSVRKNCYIISFDIPTSLLSDLYSSMNVKGDNETEIRKFYIEKDKLPRIMKNRVNVVWGRINSIQEGLQ